MTTHHPTTADMLADLDAKLGLLELALAGHEDLRVCELGVGLFQLVDELQRAVRDELARLQELAGIVQQETDAIAARYVDRLNGLGPS